MLVDADNGLGMVTGQLAIDLAIDLAATAGVGVVSVRNSNHSGMLAVHVLRAARAGMVGFFTSNGAAIMAVCYPASQSACKGNGQSAIVSFS